MALVAQHNHTLFFHEIEEIEDFNLRKATADALQTGKLTPIIKEELKLFIQSRRLSFGQDELTVTFSSPNRDEKNSLDPEKLFKRRKQNREAAKRFRQRRKTKYENVINELERQEKKNMELKLQIQHLTARRNSMIQILTKMLKEKTGIND